MNRKNLFAITLIVILAGLFSYIVSKYSKRPHCNYIVFIKGELGEDADQVLHYSSGITSIKYCDGTEVSIPTYRLIKVVEK